MASILFNKNDGQYYKYMKKETRFLKFIIVANPSKNFYIKTSEREDLCERRIGYEINTYIIIMVITSHVYNQKYIVMI